jgi:IPT/TIG domain-containing protein/cysteine-rich secretory family protein
VAAGALAGDARAVPSRYGKPPFLFGANLPAGSARGNGRSDLVTAFDSGPLYLSPRPDQRRSRASRCGLDHSEGKIVWSPIVVPRVLANSKHAFGVLARAALRSPARRSLTVSLLGVLVMGVLPILPAAARSPVHLVTTPAASGGWLDRFNQWRISTGVPSLTENTLWSAGDYNHAVYMVKNNLVTHYETPGVPYYTSAGDTAARNSNLNVSSSTSESDQQAIDWWMGAPFHAMGMMDPRLMQTGFGSYREVTSGWQMAAAVDVLRGNSFTGGQYPVYFPGNGTTEPLLTYSGFEYPDPLQACPGYSLPAGLPVSVQLGGNVSAVAGPVHSFTGNGVALEHCIIDSTNPTLGGNLVGRGGVILIPRQPLQTGVKYVVALTINGVARTWSFSVGPLYTPPPTVTGVAPTAGPSGGGTPVTITGTGFGSGLSSVKFGTSSASSFSVVNGTTVVALSPAHALGSVNVTVTTVGGTSAISSADQYTFVRPACASAGLSSNKASPQPGGTIVTFTASAAGSSCASPLFEFWTWSSSGGWMLQQAYSSSPTLVLNTVGMAPGTYTVDAWVEQSGSVQRLTGYETFGLKAWTVGGCDYASMTPNPAPTTGTVHFVAAAQGSGCSTPLYQFYVYTAATGFVSQGPFSTTNTLDVNTANLGSASYTIDVWVKQQGSPMGYETWALSTIGKGGPCGATSSTVSATQPTPQSVGTGIDFTTATTGCASPQYRYWLYPGAGGTWQMLKDYNVPGGTYRWDTTGLKPGTYSIVVHVRRGSSTADNETYGALSYSVTGASSATLGGSPLSPQALGTSVTLTTSAPGTAPVFQVWLYAPGGPWTQVQNFGPNATLHWDTSTLVPGTYAWVVYAKQVGSGNPYDSFAELNFSVT